MTNYIVLRYSILFDVMRDIIKCNKCNFKVRKLNVLYCIRVKEEVKKLTKTVSLYVVFKTADVYAHSVKLFRLVGFIINR